MAGIFGLFDFTKEGKGVRADEPRKPWYIRIFRCFGNSYTKIFLTNLVYILIAGIFLAAAYGYLLPGLVSTAMNVDMSDTLKYYSEIDTDNENWYDEAVAAMGDDAEQKAKLDKVVQVTTIFRYVAILSVMLPVLTFGCAYSGMCYNTREAVRDKPFFVWSDFWKAFRINWKQTLIMTFVNIAAMIVFAVGYWFYTSAAGALPDFAMAMGRVILVIVFVIYLMMNMYIYPLIVSFDFKLRVVIRNAFSLSMLRFFPNLGALLFVGLLAFGLAWLADPFVVAFMVLLGPAFASYVMNFAAWSAIEKYVVIPEEGKGINEGALFSD